MWWDVPKKTLAVGGQVFRFLVRLFFRPFWNSPLSDVWVPIWPHGPPVSKAFFGPFLCVKAFFGPFLCGGTFQKKNLGSGGAGVPFFGQAFFQSFLE